MKDRLMRKCATHREAFDKVLTSRRRSGWLTVSITSSVSHIHSIILTLAPDYSCAYNGRQGWLYISENYMGFYSFLLGVETKALVELKDIQDMKKEKSKRNMFSDSLLIVTKDKKEVYHNVKHSATCKP
jgi:hypothetical protein